MCSPSHRLRHRLCHHRCRSKRRRTIFPFILRSNITHLKCYCWMTMILYSGLFWYHPNQATACLTSVDCSMNGECQRSSPPPDDPQTPGTCHCTDGWKGTNCEEFDFVPVLPEHYRGLQLPHHVSTWGGSVIERDGQWHMFASRMVLGCGLNDWATNSEVIRAVSWEGPYGPYSFQEVVVPVFAHDANAIETPQGDIVLFVTARLGPTQNMTHPRNCTARNMDNNNNNNNNNNLRKHDRPPTAPPKDTYMLWAPHPNGPWSKPVLVLNSTQWNSDYWNATNRIAKCDANVNGLILPNNSFVGFWRKCETPNLLTIPHLITAEDWRNASTYQPHTDSVFVLGGSGAEDPSQIWTTTHHPSSLNNRGKSHPPNTFTNTTETIIAYHTIFHDEQATRCMLRTGCSANGRHAFSLDGHSWRYSPTDAYTRNIEFQESSSSNDTFKVVANTRARPHVVMSTKNNGNTNPTLWGLSTGLKATKESDYVWTLIQPFAQPQPQQQQQQRDPFIDKIHTNTTATRAARS